MNHVQGKPGGTSLGCRGAVGILFLILLCTTDVLRVQLSRGLLQSAGRAVRTFQSQVPLSALCHVSLTQDYELEAEKLRSLLDLEHGRSSHVSKRARLQSPAAKVREEVSPVAGPCWSCRPARECGTQAPETHMR